MYSMRHDVNNVERRKVMSEEDRITIKLVDAGGESKQRGRAGWLSDVLL